MIRKARLTLTSFLVLTLFAISTGFLPVGASAQSASELQGKIEAQNKAISDLEAEIANYQKQLVAIGKNKDTLANAIAELNLESKQLAAQIKVTESKITAANLKLKSLGDSIEVTSDSIEHLTAAVVKNIRDINIEDTNSLASFLLGDETLADMWQYAAEQESVREALRERTSELSNTKQVLVTDKAKVEETKRELVSLDNRLRDQRAINTKTQSQKNALLKDTKNQESAYQRLIKEKEALKTQLEGDLRTYESRLKYVLNPNLLPPAGSAALIWPVDRVVITQYFGKTADAGRLYASGTHNGIDFGIPIGTPIKAMANGTVAGTGNTDLTCPRASYGMWVYIKFDNGLSGLYGHLSLIKVSAGARVRTGDVIAYSGATGYATGPHLHLTVIAADAGSIQSFPSKACSGRNYTAPVAALNAYLDPMLYLPKR